MDDVEFSKTLASSPGQDVDGPDASSGQGMDTLQGSFIGNYRVVKPLGEGAMGKVLQAEHPRIGRKVAIKVLRAELSTNPEICERFVDEARAVNAIAHRNIIEIFDFGNLPDGRLYFVMEFMTGEDLGARLERKRLHSPAEVEPLLAQLAAALDAAHSAGVVHRDLKPDNIYLAQSPDGPVVKVLDFGIAKLLEKSDVGQAQTASGMIMGTPVYMAPEQAAGDVRSISAASDIYSLGVILFQMLTGTPPYTARTTAELLRAHIVEPPPPIKSLRPDLPEAVAFCVDQCLSKERDERPASAGVVHEIFKAGLEQKITIAQAATALRKTAAAKDGSDTSSDSSAGTSYEPSPGTLRAFAPSSRRALVFVLVGLVVLGVGAAAYFAIRGQKSATSNEKSVGAASFSPSSDGSAATLPARTDQSPTGVPAKSSKGTALILFSGDNLLVRAEVTIGSRPPFHKLLPFAQKIPVGERVTARFTRPGHRPKVVSWIVTGPKTLEIKLKRRSSRSRTVSAHRSRSHANRPPPMRRRTAVDRPPMRRPAMRPRAMGLDVGTLRPMF